MDGQSVPGQSKSQQTSRPGSHYEGLRLNKLLFQGKKTSSGPQVSLTGALMSADFLVDWPGVCACLITLLSLLLVIVTFPLSLLLTVKVVQEYERAVIFRLGRLLSGGARGPGIFFILPCVDNYTKVDMRVITFDVPPQEVGGGGPAR